MVTIRPCVTVIAGGGWTHMGCGRVAKIMYLHFSCFVGQDHSAPLCRKTSRYCLLIHHSCPIFIAGISCCSIIFLICCLVVFSSTAVSATVNSSVTPTGHRPFSRPGSSHLCIRSCASGTDHGRAIPSRRFHW